MKKITDFFSFRSKFALTTFQCVPLNPQIDDLKLIKGNYEGIDFPVVFKHESGKQLSDILDTGYPGLFLISNKLKLVLEENQLTGWEIYLVQIFDRKGDHVTGYHGFSIVGRCDDIDYKKSEIIKKKRIPTGPLCSFYKGIHIDGWDGSDFFSPKTALHIFVTTKVAELLKKNKITNLSLENLADKEIGLNQKNQSASNSIS